jgi:hypothetical protein
MTKTCSKCRQNKQIEEFHKNKSMSDGLHHYCKSCNSNLKKASYDYAKSKNRLLINKYNISIDQVQELFAIQKNKCKICNIEHSSVTKFKGLYIDHCHINGNVRGLLCVKCNILLGACRDNISILKSAIKYLDNSKIKV